MHQQLEKCTISDIMKKNYNPLIKKLTFRTIVVMWTISSNFLQVNAARNHSNITIACKITGQNIHNSLVKAQHNECIDIVRITVSFQKQVNITAINILRVLKKDLKSVIYLCRNLLSRELLANCRAVELDVAIVVPHDAVGDLLRLLVDLVHLAADESLYREECVLRVNNGLALGDLAHEAVAGLGVRHDGGRGPRALCVGDDRGLAALHGGHRGIGGAKVDAYHLLARHPQRAPPAGPAVDSRGDGGAAPAGTVVGREEGGRGGDGRGRHGQRRPRELQRGGRGRFAKP